MFKSLRISKKKIAPKIMIKISNAIKNPLPYDMYRNDGIICQ
jgi:hypothetical protein